MGINTKKLTLEERLSLAAKKGKKKPKKIGSSSASASPPPSIKAPDTVEDNLGTDEFVHLSFNTASQSPVKDEDKEKGVQGSQDGTEISDNDEEIPASMNDDPFILKLSKDEPWSVWLTEGAKHLNSDELLKILQPHVEEMVKENNELKKSAIMARSTTTDSSFVKLMKEKDETIAQLRQEGETLSKTELRQSNLIKAGRTKITELENELDELRGSLYEETKHYEELYSSNKDTLILLTQSENKINELTKYRDELLNTKSALDEKESRIESLEKMLELKQNELSEAAASHQREIAQMKSATEEHVLNLESSLEELRIEVQKSSKHSEVASSHVPSDLQENYRRMCEDFKSSKGNSQAIENALNKKISTLEAEMEKIKRLSDSYKNNLCDNVKLNGELESKLSRSESIGKSKELQINELELKVNSLETTIRNLTDDFNLLQHKYNIQRTQLELNVDRYKPDNELQLQLPPSPQIKDFEPEVSRLEDNWMISQNASSLQQMETPKILKDSFITKDDNSISSQVDRYDISMELEDIPDEASDLGSLLNRETSYRNTSSKNLNRYSSEVGSSARVNAQVVSKLGAEIRKFEVEMASLQNLCDRTQKEKNDANNEIIRLLEENEKVNSLKNDNLNLSKQVGSLQDKLDASLQILGEKTELVDELENDVADLKDMMKQQIQEMMRLQDKL